MHPLLRPGFSLLTLCASLSLGRTSSFVNFETAPVHPVALSPDGRTLAVCNLPDARIMLFGLTGGLPVLTAEIPVGIDPVTVQFRNTNELWVVNSISSSLSIVDLSRQRVIATVQTLSGPADLVFAGTPLRAFVSCPRVNKLQVFDPASRLPLAAVAIDGERPKALAVSSDRAKVYVAIFESGNRSTILAPPITQLDTAPEYGPLGDPSGPSGGQNPPPNAGTSFEPPINPDIPTNYPPPIVSHIVKKSTDGRWLDDNNIDWSEYISGNQSETTGRIAGWDLLDHDVAVVDAATLDVQYLTGLMNICMDLAVNPVSGAIAVVGTDATNERRFEPNVRATFLRVNLALVQITNGTQAIKDLNPHLTYSVRSLPQSERDKSVSDPRGVLWNSSGNRAYVTGMGSRNLIVLDENGDRVTSAPIELGDGPTGMALDEVRSRLYVLNRFSASVSVVDTTSHTVMTNIPFFDPTPAPIRLGRVHFYDTRRNSGLGHTACASCHVDGRMDRLAWDLGDPSGNLVTITNYDIWGNVYTRSYHPMKGPMVTQTMQDIIGHEPFHWRGDRVGIEDFNQTFPALLGRDQRLTATEMQEFKAFLASLTFPPNLERNLDDTLATNVSLAALGTVDGEALGLGNALQGRDAFNSGRDISCTSCHSMATGLSSPGNFALGPHGERNLRLIDSPRSAGQFKGPQLRNMAEKVGLDFRSTTSRAGFGFTHDGRADTLPKFLQNSVAEALGSEHQQLLDVVAFVLSMSGTDPDQLSEGGDVATGTGRQVTLTDPSLTPGLESLLSVVQTPGVRVDLIARGTQAGLNRGWLYAGTFLSDRHGEELSLDALLALASADHPLTFTLVPQGSGARLALDRDNDGTFDRTEMDSGWDPLNPASRATNRPPQLTLSTNSFLVHPGMPIVFNASAFDPDPGQTTQLTLVAGPNGATIDPDSGEIEWLVPPGTPGGKLKLYVRAADNGTPAMVQTTAVGVELVPLRMRTVSFAGFYAFIHWDAIPGLSYRLQLKQNAEGEWLNGQVEPAQDRNWSAWIQYSPSLAPQYFFRVKLETD